MEDRRPSLKEFYKVLIAISKSFECVFFILDALDECDEGNQRGELFPLFHRMAEDNLDLFVTSRQYPEDIQDSLGECAKIELSAQEGDIRTYVEERINQSASARRLVRQGRCKDTIISSLIDCSKRCK